MLEVAAVVAMEGSPPASGVPRPRDQRDCQAEVIISRRAPPSLLVSHNGCGLPLPLDPALLLLRFRFQAVAYGRLSISILPIWSTGGEPGCVWRRWRPASAPYKPRQSSAEAMTSTGFDSHALERDSSQISAVNKKQLNRRSYEMACKSRRGGRKAGEPVAAFCLGMRGSGDAGAGEQETSHPQRRFK
uniref:Uncharacterized protein n=1 Tax=Triticum urartu TaxID=4572 RepID=A0A8R7R366_TRIUA